MVNIMTVKRTIETNKTAKTTAKKSTTKRTISNVNTFELDEKSMVLKISLPVEWNKTHTGLKAKHVQDVEGKEYKKLSIVDKVGNEIYLFKTTFGYEPVVKESKISKADLDTSKLSDEEQKMLELLMKKMSK
jgi:hypothetical protein